MKTKTERETLYLNNPERLDQYGRPSKWFLDYPGEYLDALVDELKKLELIFQIEFGLSIYLTWGSLLGAVREGDLIPHDFDIDVGYVSRAQSEEEIRAEREGILKHFQEYGRVLSGYDPGRFMILTIPSASGKYDHGVEIYTSFVVANRFYAYPTLPGTLSQGDVEPFRKVLLRDREFFAPQRAELFLQQAIGQDWRTPKLPVQHNEKDDRYPCFEFLYPDPS